MSRILILGGTGDANALARAVAAAGLDAVYSYAGRTHTPVDQPLPVRLGGYGGAEGLATYLRQERITHLVDATHPFAQTMSHHALAAAAATATPLIALVREPWAPAAGDRWITVPDLESAVQGLPDAPTRVFLAIGRQHLQPFAAKPQHAYLLRFVDAPKGTLPLAGASVVVARGPFTEEADLALLREQRIAWLVTRNSGGSGASAKLGAARALQLPVIMIARPPMPPRRCAASVEEVMAWLAHAMPLGA